ncbi:MAG: hydantoinase B/oxoprolinase family protein, partial [Candidatus Dormibacteraceae bacterium]
AVGMRYSTAVRVHDLVLGALIQALPGQVPVAGAGQTVVTYISTSELGQDGRVIVANPVQGGSGGGVGLDGIDGLNFGAAFLRNVPVEILESEAPCVVHRFAVRPDSEGAGRWRGGYGVDYALEVRHPRAVVVMRGKDRQRFTCWGAAGGQAGTVASNLGYRAGEPPVDVGKRTVYRPRLGETLSIVAGGGGGFGNPLERSLSAIAADLEDGLLSPGRARSVYGAVQGTAGEIDEAASAALRARLRPATVETGFDLGSERVAWERRYGSTPARLARRLCELPAALQRPAQAQVYATLDALGAGPHDDERIERVIEQVFQDLRAVAKTVRA